jgi:vacuolar iron transporter family protein
MSVALEAPIRHALATTFAFVLAGAVPLLAFALGLAQDAIFPVAVVLALGTLATVGAARSQFTQQPRIRCAVEMVAVGGGASAVAYVLGVVVDPLLH